MSNIAVNLSLRAARKSFGLWPLDCRVASLLAMTVICSTPAFSAEADPLNIVITPTRTAKTADQSLAPVSVITRADIERSQAQSVQDVLRGIPGVTLANQGGAGKLSALFLRGANPGHVLVLVDGVRLGSATAGTTAFEHIPVEQIERIEVVRGPRSSLYGSEAIGGVIQIFTRKGGGKLTPSFSVTGGSYDTGEATAGISGGGDHAWFNVNASGFDTQGFNSCQGAGFPIFKGCFTDEPDKDGYRSTSGSVRGGYRFDNGAELDAHWLRAVGKVFYDGGFVNESETVQQVIGASARFSPAKIWTVTLLGGRSNDELDSFNNGAFMTRFDTERDTLSVQNDFTLAQRHIVTIGADYQEDSVGSSNAYAVNSRDNKALFAQYQAGFGRHDFEFSGRGDDNEQFGNHATGSAAWGYAITDGLRAIASYGTAFKAPTFNDLYFPDSPPFYFSNPNLDPEKSRSAEIGLRGAHPLGSWSANLFETRIDDLIAYDFPNMVNINQARIRGLELEGGARIDDWRANASLTLLDPEDRSDGPNHGNRLARRTRQSLKLDIDRDFGHSSLGLSVLGEGDRYDDAANTQKVGGFATVDLRAGYQIAKHWLLQAKLVNLFDADYETVDFYNQAGRSGFITLRYAP